MQLTLLSAEDLRLAVPMKEAIGVMKEAFAAVSSGRATLPQRTVIEIPEHRAVCLNMPAHLSGFGLGAKTVSVYPENPSRGRKVINGLMLALDPETGEPSGLANGSYLTALRTGAATGVATDLLARKDSKVAALFGCGGQARTQLLALAAVRAFEEIRVIARGSAAVERFIDRMQPHVPARLVAAISPKQAVEGADVVCTATTSHVPVFQGEWLSEGTHVNGIGSYTSEMQENDERTVARSTVFVDQQEAALAEAGDLVAAVRSGHTQADEWVELGQVVVGAHPGRSAPHEITFWKSVGLAVQDVALMARALQRAERLGLGSRVDL